MGNSNYNSLTQKLILDGIIPSEDNNENFFEKNMQQKTTDSPIEEMDKTQIPPKKRLNNYDLELINKADKELINNEIGIKKFIYKLFPKLYKARLIKEAMENFLELNIDPKTLLDKTIPYGEAEIRYKDLVKYLKYATEIQGRFNSKD